jgi:hypothetical protein
MSRFWDDGDGGENFPGEAALWEANYERALRGKRGRQVLAELREALMALPEHRLIEGALCTVGATAEAADEDAEWTRTRPPPGWSLRSPLASSLRDAFDGQGEGVCGGGALLWHRAVKAGATPEEAFAQLPRMLASDHDLGETASLLEAAGVAYVLAWQLVYRNDETFRWKTPEQRHAAFIAWIDEQLAVSAA